MTDPNPYDELPERPADEPVTDTPPRTSRDVLYERIGIELVNAGVLAPAAQFVEQVRQEAGYRVSPREIATVVTQITAAERPVTAESVAEIVSTSRGDRSQRQQRNADLWRALGAQLVLHDRDGSPEGQRRFIGEARKVAGPKATDALLLQIALGVAEAGARLDPETVGKIGRRLAASAADLTPAGIATLIPGELRAIDRRELPQKRTRRPGALGRRLANVPEHIRNPGARKMRAGKPQRRSRRPKPNRP